jgi:hypothetical protein
VCEICEGGKYSERASGSTRCLTCAAGTFSVSKQSACALCPGGTFSLNGSTVCSDCLAGSYSNAGMSVCSLCFPGSYSGRRQSACTLCIPGFFSDTSNSTACSACQAGTFSGALGSDKCKLCEHGKYYPSAEATACLECPAAHNTTGTGKVAAASCRGHCPPGESGFNGVKPCTICAPGKFASVAGTGCPDSVENKQRWQGSGMDIIYTVDGTCEPHSCPLCAPGTSAANFSTTACDICPLSFYSGAGQQYCTACSFGLVTLELG